MAVCACCSCQLTYHASPGTTAQLHTPGRACLRQRIHTQEPLGHKKARVEELLDTLALRGCSNSYIGGVLARGISGGQVFLPTYMAQSALPCLSSWTPLQLGFKRVHRCQAAAFGPGLSDCSCQCKLLTGHAASS